MTSVFASRRRAEEFHSLVEAPAGGASGDARPDAHLDEFLAIVATLRDVPDAAPRPEFVTTLREQLLSAADTELVTETDARLTLPPRNARRDRRIAAAIGGIAVVGAGTSMAVAAQSALPGEMLYPLKRVIEDAGTGVASGPEARGLNLLDLAASRLGEVEALDREGRLSDDTPAVSAGFVDFGDQATRAADLILERYAATDDDDLVRQLRDFTGNSMDTLEGLESQVPASARDELLGAVDVVSDIDARAREACPSCGGRGVDQIPPVLLSSAATDALVVVIPGATVEASQPLAGDDRRTRSGDRRGGGGGGDEQGLTGPVLSAPGDDPDGEGGSGAGATDPLTDLADTLTGDQDPPASNGGGVDVGGVDVGGGVKDTVDGAKKELGGVKKNLEKTTEQLGDSLLGD